MYEDLEEWSDAQLGQELANRMSLNDYELIRFINERTLADTLKFESFISNNKKFTLEQFELFIKQITNEKH